ncbi:hypothetical protein GCM10011289_11470 [Paludibacterium paludis]|uniref:Virulence factor YopE GAP domain-containing protein n=2 Tax=Paludibacterium paludis TaxID=1225769 RepID=A0A918U8K4_9NEIS|nr:hypothetical protein GCM10011289_11470 [Paludibacterium paludis]
MSLSINAFLNRLNQLHPDKHIVMKRTLGKNTSQLDQDKVSLREQLLRSRTGQTMPTHTISDHLVTLRESNERLVKSLSNALKRAYGQGLDENEKTRLAIQPISARALLDVIKSKEKTALTLNPGRALLPNYASALQGGSRLQDLTISDLLHAHPELVRNPQSREKNSNIGTLRGIATALQGLAGLEKDRSRIVRTLAGQAQRLLKRDVAGLPFAQWATPNGEAANRIARWRADKNIWPARQVAETLRDIARESAELGSYLETYLSRGTAGIKKQLDHARDRAV